MTTDSPEPVFEHVNTPADAMGDEASMSENQFAEHIAQLLPTIESRVESSIGKEAYAAALEYKRLGSEMHDLLESSPDLFDKVVADRRRQIEAYAEAHFLDGLGDPLPAEEVEADAKRRGLLDFIDQEENAKPPEERAYDDEFLNQRAMLRQYVVSESDIELELDDVSGDYIEVSIIHPVYGEIFIRMQNQTGELVTTVYSQSYAPDHTPEKIDCSGLIEPTTVSSIVAATKRALRKYTGPLR